MKPEWKHKTEFGIVKELRAVVLAAKEVAEKERDALRKRLDKLTYGA